MKFKRRITQERGELSSLDIAPLINVVFLLLIFFVFTSVFVVQPAIKIDLPRAVTSEVLYKRGLVVIINSKDELYLNERRISKEELLKLIRISSEEERSVLIKADKKASLGRVVEIWDMARDEGISAINIATSQE